MLEKIICEYCNKRICKLQIKRHHSTKECRNKQQNLDIILEIKEYKCKHCNKCFNRLDQKNEHESNVSCNSKDILSILNEKNQEIILLKDKYDEIIKQKNEENAFLKSQLQTYRPNINSNNINNNSNNNTNITINNTININFDDIKHHLDKFNIHILSDHTALIHFIMNIFSNKVKLTNDCKQIMSYYLNDKLINDIKCKVFLSNSAGQLTEISDKLCKDGKHNKNLNDTIVKSACLNNILLNDISSEKGIKKGVRKNKPIILVNEIIKYLKENGITDIQGV
jgi:hypothetical protein